MAEAGLVESGEAPKGLDSPLCVAECTSLLIGTTGIILLISGLGFWTVQPPGEDDLCRIETLGLQNKTTDEQNMDLQACHALYSGVFESMKVISLPFIGCAVVAVLSAYLSAVGVYRRHQDDTPKCFQYAVIVDVAGLVGNFAPSLAFGPVLTIVAAALAPIHAYFITIMVGHMAIGVANYSSGDSDEGTRDATYVYDTLYMGYCAASRVELCLSVGGLCIWALNVMYIFDILAHAGAMFCCKPDYERAEGSQLARSFWMSHEKFAGGKAQYDPVSQTSPGGNAPGAGR